MSDFPFFFSSVRLEICCCARVPFISGEMHLTHQARFFCSIECKRRSASRWRKKAISVESIVSVTDFVALLMMMIAVFVSFRSLWKRKFAASERERGRERELAEKYQGKNKTESLVSQCCVPWILHPQTIKCIERWVSVFLRFRISDRTHVWKEF